MLLRPFQIQALEHLKAKKVHLICTAPTGSGKGVILEKIATNRGERILLITPLIALARQQAQRFEKLGLTVYQTLGLEKPLPPPREYQVWMLSPERLLSSLTQEKVRSWNPTLIAVDECHCIWEWGSGFRPAYERIPNWISETQIERTLWMSATLPHENLKQLNRTLKASLIRKVGEFSLPENLTYRIQKIRYAERQSALIRYIETQQRRSGIVFAFSRKTTEALYRVLMHHGIKCAVYHAGLFKEERLAIEGRLNTGENLIVLATNAFGLGMDFKTLDFVCAYQPSFNLLSLIQAIGRVGRTRPGDALIYYHEEDFRILSHTFRRGDKEEKDFETLYTFLKSNEQRRNDILKSYFV